MLHSWSWVIWLGAALAALSLTRNPLYLTLTVLCIAVVITVLRPQAEELNLRVSPLRFALVAIPLAALLNGLMVHVGTSVLLRLPDWLPLIGGPITLEALVYGALNGLVLAGMLAAFHAVILALPTQELIRLIPRAFSPLAVVASVALTFVPATLREARQAREAQAIRGHQLRGLRDWAPLWVPLLVGGLERALQLAESMVARGFAAGGDRPSHPATQAALIGGLAALLGGWLLRLVWGQQALGRAIMLVGALVVIGTVWAAGRRIPHSSYRIQRWSWSDLLVIGGAALTLAAFLLPLPGLDRSTLTYYPYPTLSLPAFDVGIGVAILGLLTPAALLATQTAGEPQPVRYTDDQPAPRDVHLP